MVEDIYLVWHSHPTGANEQNEKLLGVFLTEEEASACITRAMQRPGFVDYPEGFQIARSKVGKDYWEEGYFTE
jgi:homoserine kinase type II